MTPHKFGTNKMQMAQFLVADGTAIKIENNKIKKKACPGMFKAISNLSTVTTYVAQLEEKAERGRRGGGERERTRQ